MLNITRLFATSALSGVVLLTGACQAGLKAEEKRADSVLGGLGGDPLKWNKGDTPWTKVSGVRAVYDAFVVMKFDEDMALGGRVYFFDASGNDYGAIRGKLEAAMTKIAAKESLVGTEKFRLDVPLSEMHFKNVTNVVVLFDHAKLKFPDCGKPTDTDTGCRQIFFTDILANMQPARPNDTFYNLVKDSLTYKKDNKSTTREIIFFQNLHREKAGGGYRYIPETELVNNPYSLNIFARAADAESGIHPGWPIIVDPDTGNYGQGGRP